MDNLLLPWMVEIGLVSWRTVKFGGRPPLPSELLASFVIFGGFSIIPNRKIGTTMGWGIVVASALNLLPSIVSGPSSKTNRNPFGAALGIDPSLTPGAKPIPQEQIKGLQQYIGESQPGGGGGQVHQF